MKMKTKQIQETEMAYFCLLRFTATHLMSQMLRKRYQRLKMDSKQCVLVF